jgi:hypothetical protein
LLPRLARLLKVLNRGEGSGGKVPNEDKPGSLEQKNKYHLRAGIGRLGIEHELEHGQKTSQSAPINGRRASVLDNGSVEIVLNGSCCERLPSSMIEEVKEVGRVWLIPKRGQLEGLVEKNTLKDGVWVVELFEDAWIARIVVRDGNITDVRMERGSAIYQGKAAIAMINSLAGPANVRVFKLKSSIMGSDPLENFFFGRRIRGTLKEVVELRAKIIDAINRTYKLLTETRQEDLCKNLMDLQSLLDRLFGLEDKFMSKNINRCASASSHKFEHAIMLRSLGELVELACRGSFQGESLLAKFLRLVDDLKIHFSQRDVEIYRIM